MKVPDCELPRVMTHLTLPASGFAVPRSSAVAFLKNDAASRNAAVPTVRTRTESCDLKTTW